MDEKYISVGENFSVQVKKSPENYISVGDAFLRIRS